MVAPAFGFGAGDLVKAIELIGTVSKALRDTDGAATSYQQASLELSILQGVLNRVQALEVTAENADIVEAIRLCSLTCETPLK
jgi:hypothetical protein